MNTVFFTFNLLVLIGGFIFGFSLGLYIGECIIKKFNKPKHEIFYYNWPKL